MSDPASKGRVLVADDNLSVRRILCLFLQGAGYETVEARNGKEALELARSARPALLVLDVMMPMLDGFAACRLLKADPATRDMPIIICTAKNRKEDLIEAIKAGAEDYIVKPFNKETVLAKVERVFTHHKTGSSSRMAAVERRAGRRKAAGWALSWGAKGEGGLAPVYKSRVLDISVKGFAFEFVRCDICTGYEQGTIHPLCLFARHAKRFRESEPVDFVLSIKKDIVVEVQGKIAHVFQWPENPKTERVGVAFTNVPESAHHIIEQYVEGILQA